MKFFVRLFSALCLLASVSATEPTDLGQGLSYLRVRSPADSCKAVAAPGALVLDLRYATTDAAAVVELQSALAARPAGAPLFVLVGPATPPALLPLVRQPPALTLGLAGMSPAPRVAVKTDAATDRKAYEALEAGTTLDALITGKIEKERFDEATLVEEFNNGNPDAMPPPPPDPTAPKADGAPDKPAVLTDRVLQRAVHLHRALLALRR